MTFPKGYEGVDNAYDLGWKHGTEDIGYKYYYHPGISLSEEDFEDYKEGYKDAREGWD